MNELFGLFLEISSADDMFGSVTGFASYKKNESGDYVRCDKNEIPEAFKVTKEFYAFYTPYIKELEKLLGSKINKRIKIGIGEALKSAIQSGYYAYAPKENSSAPFFSIGPPGSHSEIMATNEILNEYLTSWIYQALA